MPYLPELHYCFRCNVYLGPDNGDGICGACDLELYEEENGAPADDVQAYYDAITAREE